MKLSPTEERFYRVLRSCRAAGTEMTSADLLERLGIANRHILKTHASAMRRKGVPVRGHRGGSPKFGRCGGYYLDKVAPEVEPKKVAPARCGSLPALILAVGCSGYGQNPLTC